MKSSMNKFTKIIATIGPVSDSPEMIEKLIKAGVNVFRFNFKHNTVEWHSERIARVNRVAEKMGLSVGTLIDLQGPEIRIKLPQDELALAEGDMILLSEKLFVERERSLSISHPSIIPHLRDGQSIIADDGHFVFELKEKNGEKFLVSLTNGVLKNNKSMNIPGAEFPFPVLIERDFEGLKLAAKHEIDFIALSFVRTHDDLKVLRSEMEDMKIKANIIAKIETKMAIEDIEAIVDEADGVMVARGDLGVELPMEQVPYYQKMIIRRCIERGKPVITATQMLETMIEKRRPTRAEVSDVANAAYDNTDATMLSAESATGKYPLETVETMARTLEFNEIRATDDIRSLYNYQLKDQEARITDTAYNLYKQTQKAGEEIEGFVVLTQTGRTARLLSRYRPRIPIFTFCPTKEAADSLTLSYGIIPMVLTGQYERTMEVSGADVRTVLKHLREKKLVPEMGKVIVIHGDYWTVEGRTSTVKIVEVE